MTEPWRPMPTGIHTREIRLPVEGRLPGFDGATGWLNSEPLTAAGLAGKVVLVNFWTFTCINWLRQLPYVRAWHAKYAEHGLVVVGVHTPEFGFERDVDNIVRSVRDRHIDYPVAIDSDYGVWSAFANHYWPALYFADADGMIRHHHFGEGEYQRSEMVIQYLLASAGATGFDREPVPVDATGAEAEAAWRNLRSPENYTGYERTENFDSPDGIAFGKPHTYAAPARSAAQPLGAVRRLDDGRAGHHAARGRRPDRLPLPRPRPAPGHGPGGSGQAGAVPGHARRRAAGRRARHRRGRRRPGTVTEQRLHQLIRQPGPIADRTFEITFEDPAQAFAFTFG